MSLWISISFAVVSALCIYAIIKLFSCGNKPFGKAAMAAYAFYAVIFFAVWIFNISVPPFTLLLTMLTVFGACFIGHYLGGYTKSRTYDRWLHAFGSFSFALFSYCVLDDFVEAGGSVLFRAIFIFLAGNTLGVFFELLEMRHDSKKKNEPKAQKGLRDTDMDMLFNLFGSALAAVLAYFFVL